MKKIFSFSLLLILGLAASQILPGMLGESYPAFRAGATTFLYVCLSFIMINVGREFEIDKKTLALLCRGLFHRYGYGSRTLAAHRSVLCFRVVAARVLGQWRRLERESVVEPFCRSDFGRHPVHDARGPAAQAKLDVSENSGAGDFRRSGYHPADDTSANPDDRSALAAFRRRGDRLSAVVAGVEETQYV